VVLLLSLLRADRAARHGLDPVVTVQYPEERRNLLERTWWRHAMCCIDTRMAERVHRMPPLRGACPGGLHLLSKRARIRPEQNQRLAGERYAEVYEIDMLRVHLLWFPAREACAQPGATPWNRSSTFRITTEVRRFTADMLLVLLRATE